MSGLKQNIRVLAVIPGTGKGSDMIFARRQAKALEHYGATVSSFYIRSRTSPLAIIRTWRELRRAVREFKPDVIHCHYGTMTAFIAAYATLTPVVITYRGSDLNPVADGNFLRAALGHLLSQVAALRAKRIICVSRELRSRLWFNSSRAFVIPTGIDTEHFRPVPLAEARAKLNWRHSSPVVLFNAGTSPIAKRLDLAEAAVAEARKKNPDIKFFVLDGKLPPDDVPLYLNASDVLLVASDYEGSPTVVQEAIACGLPVVSVDVGDVCEMLELVHPSRVVPRDAALLGAALLDILSARLRSSSIPKEVSAISGEQVASSVFGVLRSACAKLPLRSPDRFAEKCRMRICFLGNIETPHMVKWARYFAERGHDVHVISFSGDESCVQGTSIKLHVLNIANVLELAFKFGEIRRLVRRLSPDVLHGHYMGLYGLAASLTGFRPLVQTAWGSDILISPKSLLKRFLVRYSLLKADYVTCDAEHMKKAMVALGVPGERIGIVMFGVDIAKFSPAPRSYALLAKLGLAETDFIVVSLRSFSPVYDIPTLVRASAGLVRECPAARIVLIGGGPQEGELRALVKELGLERNFVFAGRVPYSEIPEYVRLASVYVSTSLSDGGISSSTAEAMACGVPVLISDNVDNALWVKDGHNGMLFEPGSPSSLEAKLVAAAREPSSIRRLGEAGRAIIVEKDDYCTEMGKVEAMYKALYFSRLG